MGVCRLTGGNLRARGGALALALSVVMASACGSTRLVVRPYGSHPDAITALEAGDVDAVYGDYAVLATAARSSGGALELAGEETNALPVGIAVRRDSEPLAQALAGALGRLMESGEYATILEAWGLGGGAVAPPSATAPGAVAPELADGVLQVGMEMESPPLEFRDEAGRDAGLDVELARAVARTLGVTLELVDHEGGFDALLPNLEAGQIDVVISGMTITPAREARARFVPYLRLGDGLLVRRGNPGAVRSLDALCGRRVAVQSGTLQAETASRLAETCGR